MKQFQTIRWINSHHCVLDNFAQKQTHDFQWTTGTCVHNHFQQSQCRNLNVFEIMWILFPWPWPPPKTIYWLSLPNNELKLFVCRLTCRQQSLLLLSIVTKDDIALRYWFDVIFHFPRLASDFHIGWFASHFASDEKQRKEKTAKQQLWIGGSCCFQLLFSNEKPILSMWLWMSISVSQANMVAAVDAPRQ